MLITFYDSYNILQKVYNGAYLKQALKDTIIRESSRAHTNKICYGVLDKDITLNYILSQFALKSPKLAIKTILKIGLYSIIYLKTPPHLVVDTCFEMAKKLGKGGASGFINGVLRSFLRKGYALPKNNLENLSIKYSKPIFLIKKLINDYGESQLEEILSQDIENTFIRFNSNIDGEEYLTSRKVKFEKTPFKDCFLVNGQKMDSDFFDGVYTFQSIGSVAICNMISGGNNLLDCCSAPGGKAVYLSTKFNSVVACDLHNHRVELINSYIERMGASNIKTMQLDMTIYNKEFDSKFDCVLCDAPCSGSGVIKDNPDMNLNRKEEDIGNLVKTQEQILNNVCNYVEIGGVLCYSTCSILQDENDRQIDKFLENHDNFEVVKTTSLLENIALKNGIQFLPHLSMGAGFYFAMLKRIK